MRPAGRFLAGGMATAALMVAMDTAGPVRAATGRYVVSGVSTMVLGTLGGIESEAYDINNAGYVVGSAQRADGTWHAFRASAAGMVDLDTLGDQSAANTINYWGVAAGYVRLRGSSARRPAVFDAAGARVVSNLTRPVGSCSWSTEVQGLDNLGRMSGTARLNGPGPTDCSTSSSAVHWASALAAPVEHTAPFGPDWIGKGFRINGSGIAVGSLRGRDAFIFRGRDALMLLPPATSPLAGCAMEARGINDEAVIVGDATCTSPANAQPAIWYTAGSRPGLLPVPAGYGGGTANDVNAQRFVAGTASPPVADTDSYYAPFLWGENLGTVRLAAPTFGHSCKANALTDLSGGRIAVVGSCVFYGYGRQGLQWNVTLRWVPL